MCAESVSKNTQISQLLIFAICSINQNILGTYVGKNRYWASVVCAGEHGKIRNKIPRE